MKKKKPLPEDDEIIQNISVMKLHLKSLRKIAGWTAEDLGKKIGLSTQTINGLENNPDTNISQAQYIALRVIFATEAEVSNNETLKSIMQLIFDSPDVYYANKEEIDSKISTIAGVATNSSLKNTNSLKEYTMFTLGSTIASTATVATAAVATPIVAPILAAGIGFIVSQILPRGKK